MKRIQINENHFDLHPSGALYWVEKKTLMIADVHLGKVAHFRKNGIAVPRKAEGAFYEKITFLLNEFEVERLLFLGDLFHSFQNNEWHLFTAWVKQQKASMILVEGNHDVIPASQFEQIGHGTSKSVFSLGPTGIVTIAPVIEDITPDTSIITDPPAKLADTPVDTEPLEDPDNPGSKEGLDAPTEPDTGAGTTTALGAEAVSYTHLTLPTKA